MHYLLNILQHRFLLENKYANKLSLWMNYRRGRTKSTQSINKHFLPWRKHHHAYGHSLSRHHKTWANAIFKLVKDAKMLQSGDAYKKCIPGHGSLVLQFSRCPLKNITACLSEPHVKYWLFWHEQLISRLRYYCHPSSHEKSTQKTWYLNFFRLTTLSHQKKSKEMLAFFLF